MNQFLIKLEKPRLDPFFLQKTILLILSLYISAVSCKNVLSINFLLKFKNLILEEKKSKKRIYASVTLCRKIDNHKNCTSGSCEKFWTPQKLATLDKQTNKKQAFFNRTFTP